MHNIAHKNRVISTLSTLALALAGTSNAVSASSMGTDEANLPTKYIVKFKDRANVPMRLSAMSLDGGSSREALLEGVQARQVEKLGVDSLYSIEADESQVSTLRENQQVEYVEVDPPRYLMSETTPWGFSAVNAQILNDSAAGNRTICIIDSGYDLNHNDLSGNNVKGSNDAGTGSWASPGNNNAHGTHVAGTIAAIANNEGIKGILPNQNVNLHIVKVFNEEGWGYSSTLVKAIQTCAANGANVVNMSLGGSESSRTEERALQSLYDEGVLLIAAAGNSGNTAHSYPASYDSVMSVAAVDNHNDHAAFSQATDQVEIAAPGVAILSTVTVGEGVLADINIDGYSYFDRGIVPHNRKVQVRGRYQVAPIAGSVTSPLAQCDTSSGRYNCADMTGKVCLTERIENQRTGVRPEINPVKACYAAGAKAAIVYSNADLPGLQSPFLLDKEDSYPIVSVSIDRALGLELVSKLGQTVTVATTTGEDYEYYNGTSMATPHVTGVAGLVWSYHPECSASQVRRALTASATDIDESGRDNRTGYGLVNSDAAKSYLDSGCNGPENDDTVLKNGVAKASLAGDKGTGVVYQFEVPDSASQVSFTLAGGRGDADLYVSFESTPTTRRYQCRSIESGNNESCQLDVSSAGTYQVLVYGYESYSNVKLEAKHNGSDTGDSVPLSYANNESIAIPDYNRWGIKSEIEVLHSGQSGVVNVDLDITHSHVGDLLVTLVAPSGDYVVLHDNENGRSNDIRESYEVNFSDTESQGIWTLRVVDSERQDVGELNHWSLTFK